MLSTVRFACGATVSGTHDTLDRLSPLLEDIAHTGGCDNRDKDCLFDVRSLRSAVHVPCQLYRPLAKTF